jgi:hypothetical protein
MILYAITSTGYRMILSADDALPTETVVNAVPASLLSALLKAEVRQQRDGLLTASDWTQVADGPLSSTTRVAWAAYREALRNVPQQEGFPATIEWPTAPN